MGPWFVLIALALTGALGALAVVVRRLGAEARDLTVSAHRFDRVAVAVDDLGRAARRRLEAPAAADDVRPSSGP